VETRCNGSVPGWNRSRNRPGNLDPLLTLVLADCNINSLRNALYDRRSSRFDIAFHGICAKTKPNMRY